MFSKPALTRGAQLSLRRPALQAVQRRAFSAAAASSGSGSYETTDVAGLKVVSRDTHRPTTKLAIVAKAGTRYEPLPGMTVGLEEYAFKNTFKRSALRIQRESELLGGQLKAYHTREALVLETSFLRSDLPYFAELLGEVVTQTRYTTHERIEEVERVLPMKQAKYSADATALALDAAHAVAFHTGLGAPLYPSTSTPVGSYLDEHAIASYASSVYSKATMSLVAEGANPEILSKWSEKFFKDVPASSKSYSAGPASKYYGGEQRIPSAYGNSMVIAFPSDISKPEFDVLAALLGGQSSISWSPGFTLLSRIGAEYARASNIKYSDAGLFAIQLAGVGSHVKAAAEASVEVLQKVAGGVSKEDLTKAIAKAKFDALEAAQHRSASLLTSGIDALSGKVVDVAAFVRTLEGVSADRVQAAAKSLLDGKASVAAVGDLFILPYAADLGLKV